MPRQLTLLSLFLVAALMLAACAGAAPAAESPAADAPMEEAPADMSGKVVIASERWRDYPNRWLLCVDRANS